MIRVLVVDDDQDVRFTVRVALEGSPPPHGEAMSVHEVGDGVAALNELLHTPVDVVLLDVMMPGMDGFEVLHAIRQDGDDPAVVMLTAKGSETDIANAYRAGADGYVTKPFDVDDLASLTRQVALADQSTRVRQREQELQRAELLLQLERGFGSGPIGG